MQEKWGFVYIEIRLANCSEGIVENVKSIYFPKGHNVSHLNLKYEGVLFIFYEAMPLPPLKG